MLEQRMENHIRKALTGEAQKLALDFAADLRAHNMQFEKGTGYWEDKRYWVITYKDEPVCFVLVNGYDSVRHKDEPEGWIIWSDDSGEEWFANAPLDEHAKEIAWKHVDYCGHCGGICDGGTHKTIFGKEFDDVCRTTFRFDNPNAEVVECAKKLVEIRKNSIMFSEVYEKARTFLYRNARPLDLARWQYHFEGGDKDAVLTALATYQNEDGGFGHALEPDSWNPNSSPIQTWTATEILHEIDFTDAAHPIILGILRYLASGRDFTGHFWYNTVRSNNDYPHAPWWHASSANEAADSDSTCHNDYNPTACLAGFIVRFADNDSELYRLGCRIAREAFDAYSGQGLLNDRHTAACYIRLMEYCEESGADIMDIGTLKQKLREQVKHAITRSTDEWETGYICKPSQFFTTRDSVFYADNQEIAEYECEYIIKSQLEDGSWSIPWGWNDYPEQWALSKNWWKGNGAIVNLLYLKGIGRRTL